ncbi:MAG: beta-propeller fold lactonase family protein [Clostridia bacterium]|nr:beta-propeller fold lactonase family protein [Clostridia bacterium]
MKTYILSCETIENGGGIYGYELTKRDGLQERAYFPCDRPMYAVKCEKGLCVLLLQPFENDKNSGYFYVDEDLQTATEIKSTQGAVACHLCVDKGEIYIVNYLSGNVVKNGEIIEQRVGKSVHPTRQTEPHTHFVDKTPDGYLALCDLGTDTLAFYDKNLCLVSETKVPSGYGIRHLVFSKDGKYIYAVNELVPSISIFAYENGKAKAMHTEKIKVANKKANGAAIRLSQDGKKLYVSLREENVICVFAVEREKLTLLQTTACGGDSPRDFDIFEDKLICTNENSGSATCFSLEKGLLGEKLFEIKKEKVLCVL